jgi:ACR3 family arsenite efflux pump ArsB
VVASIAAGWLAAAAVTTDAKDRFTVAAEFGSRNVGVALAIAVSFLGRVDFARFAVVYALCEIPLMLLAVALFRRRTGTENIKDAEETKDTEGAKDREARVRMSRGAGA